MPLAVVCLALGGCAAPATSHAQQRTTATPVPTAASYDRPTASAGCGKPTLVQPDTSADVTITADPAISNGQTTRLYRIHVPAGYEANTPMPVILVFHGYGGTAADGDARSGFTPLAEREGFIAVYPQGLLENGKPFWASAGPVDEGIDETPFVTHVLDDVQRHYCVDARRIFATGFSNGGGMTNFLACRLAGRIAAFAPASGNYYALPGGCHPSRPVPLVVFHGTADGTVPYDGIPAYESPDWPLPSIPEYLHDWAVRDGCTAGPSVFLSSGGVTGERWTGCGGSATVVHYRVEGGRHSLPGSVGGTSAQETIWDFFVAHPLPA
ncbi:MAG TPA: PHB depolymerase family esterase [Ktedonobacterales bacterium]|nr:PHB depolymerase family esterase [Ktedonobacterales bacterium]